MCVCVCLAGVILKTNITHQESTAFIIQTECQFKLRVHYNTPSSDIFTDMKNKFTKTFPTFSLGAASSLLCHLTSAEEQTNS